MIKIGKIIALSLIPLFIVSCGSSKIKNYFADIEQKGERFEAANFYDDETVIKPGDNVLVTVMAPTLNQEKIVQFNMPVTNYLMPGETTLSNNQFLPSYFVEKEGTINMPVLGDVEVAGLTCKQTKEKLEKMIGQYIEERPVVNVQIVSFRVFVQGEVFKPGPYYANTSKFTILQALGLAGGLTNYADRTKVLLIRDNNGVIEHQRIDLTKTDIFNSPFYYVKQDDVILVEPTKSRMEDSEYGLAQSYRMQRYSVIVSTLSTVATLLAIYITNFK